MRLTKIYTRKGDKGYTAHGKNLLSKDDLLIEAMGTVDELNSSIGIILAFKISNQDIENTLTQIQNDLFDLGGELYLPEHPVISESHVIRLEQWIDQWNKTLPPLKEFILPRGNRASALTHLARTICRRAERALVRLHRHKPLKNTEILRYVNRLSDLLFVASRIIAQQSHEEELLWKHEKT